MTNLTVQDLEEEKPKVIYVTVTKLENAFSLSIRDSSYRDKQYAFFTLDEALNKVKEVYGELQ